MNAYPLVANRWTNVAIGVLLVLIIAAIILPVPTESPDRAKRVRCTSNLHHVGLALQMYGEDHAGHLPSARSWCDSIGDYLAPPGSEGLGRAARSLTCPALPERTGGYAFNAELSGIRMAKWDRSRLVLCFDSIPGWNVHGGQGIVLRKPRHPGGNLFLFEDSHVDWTDRQSADELAWNP